MTNVGCAKGYICGALTWSLRSAPSVGRAVALSGTYANTGSATAGTCTSTAATSTLLYLTSYTKCNDCATVQKMKD